MRFKRTSNRGGTLALSTILIIVLIVIGIAFFTLAMFFGGASEVKDAVNAGGLNVAVQALTSPQTTISLTSDPGQQYFKDVTPNQNGQVNLVNINRVWAKALFVAINSDGAAQDGGHDGSSSNSAQAAQAAAQAISDALATNLNTQSNLWQFFNAYAMANSVRMLGLGANVSAAQGSAWRTACLERSFEGNIQYENNLPVNYSNAALFTSTQRKPPPAAAQGVQWIVGYQPLQVANQTFWQVAFPFEQKPHLVDYTYFDQNSPTPLTVNGSSWATPVPNAFEVAGTSKGGNQANNTSITTVETNPQKVFPMQIPNAYIRIILKKNTVQFNPNGIPLDNYNYGFEAGSTQDSAPFPIGCGTMTATAYVGNEYALDTLYQAVTGFIPNPGNTMTYLLQRVQEMVPNYSMANLTQKMTFTTISTDDNDQTFFIYPNSDNSDINIASDSTAQLPSGCDGSATPEGTSQTLDTETDMPLPNFATEDLECYGSYTFPCLSLESGTRSWIPGTSWQGGCLGELTISRTTNVYFFGVCPCP
jgi:hypothetical protein